MVGYTELQLELAENLIVYGPARAASTPFPQSKPKHAQYCEKKSDEDQTISNTSLASLLTYRCKIQILNLGKLW